MGRFLGPKHHLCRRVGERMCTTDKCPVVRRSYPPGVHGVKGRGKLTGYGTQLLEKQKARTVYGILERQFRRYYHEANRRKEATDVVLLQLLETRLDNLVYRMGLSKTRAAARQLVNHGHVTVDSRKVDIASYQVRPGQTIGVDQRSLQKPLLQATLAVWGKQPVTHAWLAVDPVEPKAKLLQLPDPAKVAVPFNAKLIVEFYSR